MRGRLKHSLAPQGPQSFSSVVKAYFILFFKVLFLFFWLCWVFIAPCRLSLVAASGGYSSLQRGLLIAVTSLVAEHGL